MALIEVTECDPAGTERDEVGLAFEAGQEAALVNEWSSFDRHLLARSGNSVSGWAAIRDAPQRFTADICVTPDSESQSCTERLVDEVLALAGNNRTIEWWTRGDSSRGAAAVAQARGVPRARSVKRMECEIGDVHPDIELTPFDFDLADEFVRANNAAFAGHPDRGHLSVAALSDELARVGATGDLLLDLSPEHRSIRGFVWLKRCEAPEGEVYLLGVAPEFQGRGLGKQLLEAGLAHLRRQFGASRAALYVDNEHERAISMYRRRGFTESGSSLDCYVLST